jgi:hypothetical protein
VSFNVYAPQAAKPMISSTSEVYRLDVPEGSFATLTVAFETISDVPIRRGTNQEKAQISFQS